MLLLLLASPAWLLRTLDVTWLNTRHVTMQIKSCKSSHVCHVCHSGGDLTSVTLEKTRLVRSIYVHVLWGHLIRRHFMLHVTSRVPRVSLPRTLGLSDSSRHLIAPDLIDGMSRYVSSDLCHIINLIRVNSPLSHDQSPSAYPLVFWLRPWAHCFQREAMWPWSHCFQRLFGTEGSSVFGACGDTMCMIAKVSLWACGRQGTRAFRYLCFHAECWMQNVLAHIVYFHTIDSHTICLGAYRLQVLTSIPLCANTYRVAVLTSTPFKSW